MMNKVKRIIIVILLIVFLINGGYLLNRYVIPKVEYTIENQIKTNDEKYEVTETSYHSNELEINIEKIEDGAGNDKLTYYVADIKTKNSNRIGRAFAKDQVGMNIVENIRDISSRNKAIISINGDYYGYRGNGIIISNSKIYRDEPAREGLAIYNDGTMKIYNERETNAEKLVEEGVKETLSFGPVLVKNWEIAGDYPLYAVDTDNFIRGNIAAENPRTGIGYYEKNHYCFVVVDGREEGYSKGVTLNEFSQIFKNLGCELAYNLDGGDSSHMYFMGNMFNRPSQANGFERQLSEIIYMY